MAEAARSLRAVVAVARRSLRAELAEAAAFSQGGGGAGAAFSQGGGGGGAAFSQGGGSLSLLHSQSQISQASLDENLLSPQCILFVSCPIVTFIYLYIGDQRFSLHDDSSKRMSSFPANSASSVRDESQLQMAKTSSKAILRWNPSLPDSKCQINEDVERKFQHVASSVHKMGMVLDSVQNDVMQLNRAMKEASLDSGSIHKKFVLVETSLQQILKGQDDLKALLEGSTKSNPDQMSALNNHTSKLDEILSTLSILKQVQEDLRQLKGDIFRIFTKEMEGIVRAISSLNSRPDAMQAPTVCVLVTQLIKCTSIAAFPSYSFFLCFADVSLLTFPLFLKIYYLSVRLFPCCPAGSLVRVAYLLCFNRSADFMPDYPLIFPPLLLRVY
ncbi:hypothetical protein ACQ4PT_059425 [Festuca glaucescens]